MKKLSFGLLLLFSIQLQAARVNKIKHVSFTEKSTNSMRKIKISSLIRQDGYSWYEQFVESIESGEDFVKQYIAIKPNFLTKIDKLSGLTPLETAVVAENTQAIASILSIASRKKIPLAMEMAINKADKMQNEVIQNMLIFSFVEDDNK